MLLEKPNILVVDDKEESLLAMASLLEGFDANIITVLSGNEALAKIMKHDFALIIMDVQMPVMDGFETATIMRTQGKTPIIFVTAISVENRYAFKDYESGAVDYVLKPVEPEMLKSKVRVFLDLHEQKVLLQNEMTERRKVERVLIQSEKLKSIGIITAGISHEYNNILSIISGNVQLLQMGNKDNSKLMDVLSTITKAVDDGSAISKKMIEFAHSNADSSGFVPSNINEIIEQSLEFTMPRWKNMAQATGIDYFMDQRDMHQVSPLWCRPADIREVLVNIINNALDAMPDGGSISFGTWSKEDTLFVAVSDTGEGMAKEVRPYIFDPFFTTRCPEGAGLGLSTVYSAVKRHGGEVSVKSEEGKGSTFTLQFPFALQFQMATRMDETAMPEETNKHDAKGRMLHVLVVDDEVEMCDLLDKFLSKEGHTVRVVYNGADAIELAKREKYDLVLCDLAMSNVYGYKVIKAINKLEKVPKIGIITGWIEKLKPMDEEGMAVDFVLYKPFKLTKLTNHIDALFG